MIIRSEHSFGPGLAESSITAKWVAAIEAEGEKVEQENAPEDEEGSPSKCSVASDSRNSSITDSISGAVMDFMTSWVAGADPSVGSEHG